MNKQTKIALKLFKTDLYFSIEFDRIKNDPELARMIRVIINGAIDSDGNFGDIVDWDEADLVNCDELAIALK